MEPAEIGRGNNSMDDAAAIAEQYGSVIDGQYCNDGAADERALSEVKGAQRDDLLRLISVAAETSL